MRGFFVFLWAGVIFVFACTSSFRGLVELGVVRFRLDRDPFLSDLLLPLPAKLSHDFLLQKLGHIAAFFILTFLLHRSFHSKSLTLLLAISYAALTEFLQLFFNRGGRIFDIGFDAIGVLLGLSLSSLFTIQQSRQIHQ